MSSLNSREWFLQKIEAGHQMRVELERDGVRYVAAIQMHGGVYKVCVLKHPADFIELDAGEMHGRDFDALADAESWICAQLEVTNFGMTVCKGSKSFRPENIPGDGSVVEL